MGTGVQRSAVENPQEKRRASTALLILVVLQDNEPEPMTTYEIGLHIEDDHIPPRPISVIIKTLSKDGYVESKERIGKRSGAWQLTKRGYRSLSLRQFEADEARKWIKENPIYTRPEKSVLMSLLKNGPQAITLLVETCRLLHSPIRTALKRLGLRSLVKAMPPPSKKYGLTTKGREEANKIEN